MYNTGYRESLRSYVNNINTIEGGITTRPVSPQRINPCTEKYAEDTKALEKQKSRFREDFREGLDCRHFSESSRAAVRRTNQDQTGQQRSEWCREPSCRRSAYIYLEEHPKEAKQIVDKVILAATARIAARKGT